MTSFRNIHKYYTYPHFVQLLEALVARSETTGTNNPESFTFYTKLNLQRFRRWEKTFTLRTDLSDAIMVARPMIWWIITEAWCGDGAQTMPVMQKMALASGGKIVIRIILRDENLPIMDQYLTNGSRAIPILVATDQVTGEELFKWGPRPLAAQKMMMDWKIDMGSKTLEDIEKELHTWYTKDEGQSVQNEFLMLLSK